jgi:hypothetical protein
MRNSSDFVRDIVTNPELSKISPSDHFVAYLVQKYISGISPAHCNLVNSVLNDKLWVWKDAQEIYDFLKILLPKSESVHFQYFGKPVEKTESRVDVDSLASILELPKREVLEMLKYFPELEKDLIDEKEKILKARKR